MMRKKSKMLSSKSARRSGIGPEDHSRSSAFDDERECNDTSVDADASNSLILFALFLLKLILLLIGCDN